MSQTFILRDPEIARRMVDFIRATAGPANAAGRPLVVEIAEYSAKRSNEQNRLLWALLSEIAEQVELDGKRFSKEAWYVHYLDMYAPKQEGPRGLVPIGTSQMNKQQMQEFTTKIEVNAVQELNVEFIAV